ncbi:MAG TPA: hypothetical protein VL860_15520 [Planctomycetota bacterium]|nr:hypothetical protein [Planctomycetota bacterium]
MEHLAPSPEAPTLAHRSVMAKMVIEAIRFRLNLDRDGQYRFEAVHFAAPQVQSEYGKLVESLMLGHTVREILIELRHIHKLPPAVAEALQAFLMNLQPVIA